MTLENGKRFSSLHKFFIFFLNKKADEPSRKTNVEWRTSRSIFRTTVVFSAIQAIPSRTSIANAFP